MGRWAFAHGFDQSFGLTISVVLKIAGLPEPSKHKPSDTMLFCFPKKYGSQKWSFWSVAEGETIESIDLVVS